MSSRQPAYLCLLQRKRRLFLFLLTIATAAKIYPILFIFTAYRGRRLLKNLFIVGCGALVLNILAIYAFKGNPFLAFSHYLEVAPAFKEFILNDLNAIARNNSVYAFIRSCLILLDFESSREASEILLKVYSAMMATLTIALLGYLAFSKLKLVTKTIFVTCLILLVPQLSFDYKLVYLLIPYFMLFFREPLSRSHSSLLLYSIFGLLLFKGYYYPERTLSISPIINPILCILVLILCLKSETQRNIAQKKDLLPASNEEV